MTLDLGGLIPATILPMTDDGRIDEGGLRKYIRHVATAHPKALAINVDTGEGPHLWPKERLRVLEVVLEEVGAHGLLVFPTSAYQGTPLDPEIPVRYHAAIGDASGLPLILFQLQPALGGVNFEPETLSRLCTVAQVAAIKEASFNPQLFVEVRDAVKSARSDCVLLTGNDNFIYESFLLGAEGALIGFGAVATKQQVDLIAHALAGRHQDAREIMHRLTPLVNAIFAPPVRNYRARCKAALVMQGMLERETVRLPLLPISAAERESIRRSLIFAGELDQGVRVAEAS